ncbi:MAG: N-acetyltransferase [Caulobacteraceae bacterium]|nr:N-acetyltransferase [Caulobacteraceae bacterium]
MQTAQIDTGRLTLRAPRRSDAPRIAALANDPAIARMTTRMPYPYGLDEAWSFVERCAGHDPDREQTFAIARDDELIGMLGFYPPRSDGRIDAEIGYWLGRDYWGQGYATEAARAALRWASQSWGRKAVLSGHFSDNPASAGVLIKSGFLYTGEVQSRDSLARGEAADTRMMVWLA